MPPSSPRSLRSTRWRRVSAKASAVVTPTTASPAARPRPTTASVRSAPSTGPSGLGGSETATRGTPHGRTTPGRDRNHRWGPGRSADLPGVADPGDQPGLLQQAHRPGLVDVDHDGVVGLTTDD